MEHSIVVCFCSNLDQIQGKIEKVFYLDLHFPSLHIVANDNTSSSRRHDWALWDRGYIEVDYGIFQHLNAWSRKPSRMTNNNISVSFLYKWLSIENNLLSHSSEVTMGWNEVSLIEHRFRRWSGKYCSDYIQWWCHRTPTKWCVPAISIALFLLMGVPFNSVKTISFFLLSSWRYFFRRARGYNFVCLCRHYQSFQNYRYFETFLAVIFPAILR